jgi:hypothetical protein
MPESDEQQMFSSDARHCPDMMTTNGNGGLCGALYGGRGEGVGQTWVEYGHVVIGIVIRVGVIYVARKN